MKWTRIRKRCFWWGYWEVTNIRHTDILQPIEHFSFFLTTHQSFKRHHLCRSNLPCQYSARDAFLHTEMGNGKIGPSSWTTETRGSMGKASDTRARLGLVSCPIWQLTSCGPVDLLEKGGNRVGNFPDMEPMTRFPQITHDWTGCKMSTVIRHLQNKY